MTNKDYARVISFRVRKQEEDLIKKIQSELACTQSQAIRTCLIIVDLLFFRNLNFSEMIKTLPQIIEIIKRKERNVKLDKLV